MNSHFYFQFSISLKAKSTYSLNTRNFIPPYKKHRNNVTTRMHSSRMHTTYHVPSASVQAGIQLPGCGPGDPPGCGPGDPLGVAWRPPGVGLETPLGVGLVDPPGCGLETPQVWAWRPPLARPLNSPPACEPGILQGILGYHLQCML